MVLYRHGMGIPYYEIRVFVGCVASLTMLSILQLLLVAPSRSVFAYTLEIGLRC